MAQSEPSIKTIGELSFDRRDVLGSGSYGSVYKGKFRGCEVAIKRIEKGRGKFEFEKEIYPSIKHPNIVCCYHVEEDDDFM